MVLRRVVDANILLVANSKVDLLCMSVRLVCLRASVSVGVYNIALSVCMYIS